MGRVSDAKTRLMDAVLELLWTGSYGSTTIDHICERAGVKKGSFYYFFNSKADVAVEALDTSFQARRVELDAMFSPSVPPLERIRKYCEFNYAIQVEMKAKFGYVLGCPLFTLGAEICTQEQAVGAKISEILEYKMRYFETAIRDGHAKGVFNAPDAAAKARVVRAYIEGLLTQARIQNDLGILREMADGVFNMLGAKTAAVAA
jgi:TetR/AcrR family transcriptional regulator, transcriptional repressor for nem operon